MLLANILAHLTESKRLLLEQLVNQLTGISGIQAIVLGGSYASGAQHAASDLDIGLYYFEETPFSIEAIRKVADRFSVDGKPTVTGFYEWGAWVNGGAWVHTGQGKVDFLYRNLDQIGRTIVEAQQGISHHDFDQQPVYGFYSVIYLAETQICIPLFDPNNVIANLKQQVAVYPPALKHKVIEDSLWSVEFTLLHGRGFADQGDVYNTVGCLTRAAANLTQALFALNERYFMRDKKVMETLAGFERLPEGYIEQINHILACPGTRAAELSRSVDQMEQAWQCTVALPGVEYQPKFMMK